MRVLLTFGLILFSIIQINAQNPIYLKNYSDTIPVNKSDANFYKIISKKKDLLKIEFYNINSTPISSEHFNLLNHSIREGEAIYYTSSGEIYMQGHYLNNKMNGAWITYAGNGRYKEKEEEYLDGVKFGKSISFFPNGNPKKVYTYNSYEKIIKTSCYDSLGNKLDCDSLYLASYERDTSGIIYDRTEVMPSFPGGGAELMKFLSTNIKYPEEARKKELEGKVIVHFIVDTNGLLTDLKILNDGVGGGCAEESIRVCKLMPRWTPALQKNKFVKAFYTLPISYKLQ
ncbi:MAG: TonB family protein [Sphingobacteriales bacterium]|jgi:TonB family protein|nr:MAG: TonB family protein [Sphingobacteriales bacterium]